MPSVNGVIARNLLRLSSILEENSYRVLARQTCQSFAVEILQHPFLFVGLLDVIVGLNTGTRNITAVVAADSSLSTLTEGGAPPSAWNGLVKRIRAGAGPTLSTSSNTVAALVDVRNSSQGVSTGNKSSWLRTRNPLFKDLKAGDKNYLLICEEGRCRTVNL